MTLVRGLNKEDIMNNKQPFDYTKRASKKQKEQEPSDGSKNAREPYLQSIIKEVVVKPHTLNIRGDSRVEGVRLGYLHRGDKVQVLEVINDQWYAIKTKAGLEGYIMSEYTS